ncbi:hypothetical protein EBZ37_03165, partial [bacterium]|nr:hypothetical protein [bacterium]
VSKHDPVSFGACRPGEVIEHQVVVRIPSGTSGLLVVDLDFEGLGEGAPASERRSVTKAISIVAEGSKLKAKSSSKASPSISGPASGVVEMGHRGNVR